jgi:hypothetical protein
MFGDFMQNFGLNAFPWDSLDPQGGLFGPNAPQTPLIGSQPMGPAPAPAPGGGGPGGTVPGVTAHDPGPAPQGSPPVSPAASPMSPGGSSPLASPASFAGPGTPNPTPPQPTAPAAGVGSAFGNPLQ